MYQRTAHRESARMKLNLERRGTEACNSSRSIPELCKCEDKVSSRGLECAVSEAVGVP